MSRRERVLLPILIITIDPPKRHCKYIANDEAVRSSKKFSSNRERLRPMCEAGTECAWVGTECGM